MKLQRVTTPNNLFHIDPERFEIVSPDNAIDYEKLSEELDRIVGVFYNQFQENTREKEALSTTLDFLLSINKPKESLSEWGSNIILETAEAYSHYEEVLTSLEEMLGPPFFVKFNTTILVLKEYLYLKTYVLNFRAHYFEFTAFSKDGYSLKRERDVYFLVNKRLRVGKVYSHFSDGVKVKTRSDNFIDLKFNEIYCEKESLKGAEK